MTGEIYECSNGQFYGDADIWAKFESGEWTPCCWDSETGAEWVATETDDLLVLTPVSPEVLPEGVTTTRIREGVHVESKDAPHPTERRVNSRR